MNTDRILEIHEGVKGIDAILDRWANDMTLPPGVRSACVRSEGSLARILHEVILAAEKAA